LPPRFSVIGVAKTSLDDQGFRAQFRDSLREFAGVDPADDAVADSLAAHMRYLEGDLEDPGLYRRLAALIEEVGPGGGALFYLAIPPALAPTVTRHLGEASLARETHPAAWRRVIVEKPFGTDLASARELNRLLHEHFDEPQIFRIDHYLGKETVQNLMVFRFGNGMFEPIWNRRYIDHVQITVSETVGVELRGLYYEEAGAMRDMVPNHIFQLIALTAMEPPISFDADAVRDEKAKVLRAIQPITPEEVLTRSVRGQYGPGTVKGAPAPGYRTEPDVAPDSSQQTYVAMKLMIDNWRWADVPFYLRTGKRMPKRMTEISIHFRRAPFLLFRKTSVEQLTPNQLTIQIQPEEGIKLQFGGKVPGPVVTMGSVDMSFKYSDYFGSTPNTGYETLLYDCMKGDPTLFHRSDTVDVGWSVVTPILDVWAALPPRNFPNYPAGTWGPKEADDLLAHDGRQWRNSDR
jgi:glucose-6-phosphate 1-dehydrogenase